MMMLMRRWLLMGKRNDCGGGDGERMVARSGKRRLRGTTRRDHAYNIFEVLCKSRRIIPFISEGSVFTH